MSRIKPLSSLSLALALVAAAASVRAQGYDLTPDEQGRAAAIVRGATRPAAAAAVGGKEVITDIVGVPSKAKAGAATGRLAQVRTYSYGDDVTIVTTVDLNAGQVVSTNVSKTMAASLADEEKARTAELVRADPALRARVGPKLALVELQFLPIRATRDSELAGRRLVRVLLKDGADYLAGHPNNITVDLTEERVIVE